MSKRFWLPTRKGTELFPQTYQQPTKLVIRDVPSGTPLHDAVVQHFGGQLKQFHGKAQQDYSLSGNPQYRRHVEWSGARATYTNQFGNETLALEVDVPVLIELEKKVTEDFWDFALIELYVPNAYYDLGTIQVTCYAHLVSPVEQKLSLDLVAPVKGLAPNGSGGAVKDLIINYAEPALDARIVAGGYIDAYASFAVDLRPLRGMQLAAVDLHPYVFVTESSTVAGMIKHVGLPIPDAATPAGAELTRLYEQNGLPLTRPPAFHDHDLFNGSIYTGAIPGPFGDIYFDTGISRWLFTANNDNKIMIFHGDDWSGFRSDLLVNGEPIFDHSSTDLPTFIRPDSPQGYPLLVDAYDHNWWYDEYHIYDGSGVSAYSGPNPVPADVQVTMFKGAPDVDVTEYEAFGDPVGSHTGYTRWTFPKVFPSRPHAVTVGRTGLPVYSSTTFPGYPATPVIGNIFGVPKAGTVNIGLSLTKGGPSWQPA